MNQTFLSLEEFLALPKSLIDKIPREFSLHTTGQNYLDRYYIAKSSYLRFGEEGPPIDSVVETLISGHGGGAGVHRIFKGIYEEDPRFFLLCRQNPTERDSGESLVERALWWREIQVVEFWAEVLQRALDHGITREDLKQKFREFGPNYIFIDDTKIDKWLNGEFLHWNYDSMFRIWFRKKGIF